MQSRRDLIEAHRYLVARMTNGLLRADLNAESTPARHTGWGGAGGAALGVLLMVAAVAYGLFVPGGSDAWRKDGTLVLVEDTGERLLFLNGTLHPVLNQTSARLLAGPRLTTLSISSTSLHGHPLGSPVGIVGAPDGLPSAAALTQEPWSLCVGSPNAEGSTPLLTVGFRPLDGALPVEDLRGVLVATPDGLLFLLWNGHRFRLDTAQGVHTALGWATSVVVPVPAAFLDAIPPGPDVAPLEVAGRGSPGPTLAGKATRLGQLFVGPDGVTHYALLDSGLAALTTLQFELLVGDPRVQRDAYDGRLPTPQPIGADDIVQHATQLTTDGADLLPTGPPPLAELPATAADLCAHPKSGSVGDAVALAFLPSGTSEAVTVVAPMGITPACPAADKVSVSAGSGVLVTAMTSGVGVQAAAYVVTDTGAKYPLVGKAMDQLGYAAARSVTVPYAVLALLPTGPPLDPQRAGAMPTGAGGPGGTTPSLGRVEAAAAGGSCASRPSGAGDLTASS